MHDPEDGVWLHGDEADRQEGGQVTPPGALVLQLLHRLLQALPGQQGAPAPELAVPDPAEAADNEPPGHQGQGHHGQDPVQQPLQADPPGRGLVGEGTSGTQLDVALLNVLLAPPGFQILNLAKGIGH